MLTIKNKTKQFIFKKEDLTILLERSAISHLTKIIDSTETTFVDFDEILNDHANIDPKSLTVEEKESMWNTFIRLLNKQTIFDEADIISKYNNAINCLFDQLNPTTIIEKLMIDVIPANTPAIIKSLNLENIYIQLIFHEYIYMSQNITLIDKLRIMITNDFYQLTRMISEGQIELCTSSVTTNNKDSKNIEDAFKLTCNQCYGSNVKMNIFEIFVGDHSEWIGVDLKSCDHTKILSIILANNVFDEKNLIECINTHVNNAINLIDICHLNKIYQQYPTITNSLNIIIPKIIFSDLQKFNTLNDIEKSMMCESIDLIVRLMEIDHESIENISKKVLTKILLLWLKLSSATFTYLKTINVRNIRNIILSETIKCILNDVCMTFTEMGYILSKDRLDIFELLTEKSSLEFRNLNRALFKHMCPKIIEYILKKHLTSNKSDKLDQKLIIQLNPYDLLERNSGEVTALMELLISTSKTPIVFEFQSVANRYGYIDNPYVIMYWDYVNMIQKNPNSVDALVSILHKITLKKILLHDGTMDILLLKTAVDNIEGKLTDTLGKKLEKIITILSSENEFYLRGPNFSEIIEELEIYSVKNLNSLIKLKKEFRDYMTQLKSNNIY